MGDQGHLREWDHASSAGAMVTGLGNPTDIVLSDSDFKALLSTVSIRQVASDVSGPFVITLQATRFWRRSHSAAPQASTTVRDVSTSRFLDRTRS